MPPFQTLHLLLTLLSTPLVRVLCTAFHASHVRAAFFHCWGASASASRQMCWTSLPLHPCHQPSQSTFQNLLLTCMQHPFSVGAPGSAPPWRCAGPHCSGPGSTRRSLSAAAGGWGGVRGQAMEIMAVGSTSVTGRVGDQNQGCRDVRTWRKHFRCSSMGGGVRGSCRWVVADG